MMNFHCPDFYHHFFLYKELLFLYYNHNECFKDNIQIKSIFGMFPGASWNGGTYDDSEKINEDEVKYIRDFYFEKNIPLRFTLTNPILTKEDLNDEYCNSILQICQNEKNEILVSSKVLEDYIRKHYPLYKINHSIIATSNEKTVKEYLDECNIYNQIVLPRRVIKDWDFLSQIPFSLRHKFELLCTDHCPISCPRLYSHYEDFGEKQKNNNLNININCTYNYNSPFPFFETRKNRILPEEVNQYYESGFSEFKISGRLYKENAVITMVPYLIKQEYQQDLFNLLLSTPTI